MKKATRMRPSDAERWNMVPRRKAKGNTPDPVFACPIAAALYQSKMKETFEEWEAKRRAHLEDLRIQRQRRLEAKYRQRRESMPRPDRQEAAECEA